MTSYVEPVGFNRTDAIDRGLRTYQAVRMCKAGHMGLRRTDSGACVECYKSAREGILTASQGISKAATAIREAIKAIRARGGSVSSRPYEDAGVAFADAMGSMSAGELRAALANAPIQTEDGVLWALTATGRALGRANVAAMLPGDAMNMGLMERV